MIEFRHGDIIGEDVEALVNPANCVGVMGKGVALKFKAAFPANFKEYAAACRRGEVEPGRMLMHKTGRDVNPLYVINFPTKRHWRDKSRIEDIETGLGSLRHEIESRGIRSVAIPALGCGLGGLRWSEVRPLIEKTLGVLDGVRVVVFEPTADASPRGLPTAGRTNRAGVDAWEIK
ncbi:macro domain-containing protein [candidate division WOR-3 bacterium]|nr:macro domain-containing protein [candidate division WOR-3 bacterium]